MNNNETIKQKDKKYDESILKEEFILNKKSLEEEEFSVAELKCLDELDLLSIPDIQRNYASWSFEDVQKLVESILLNFPIEPIYLHRLHTKDKFEIIDGQHRIQSLFFFMDLKKYFNNSKVNEHVFDIKKTHKMNIDEFILKSTKKAELERIKIDPNAFIWKNFSTSLRRKILNFRFKAYIISENDIIASEIFVYLNSTGESLQNGELIRSRLIDKVTNKTMDILMNHFQKSKKVLKKRRRYEYILPCLTSYVVANLSQEEEKRFLEVVSIEGYIRKWFESKDTNPLKKIIENLIHIWEQIEEQWINIAKSKSSFYMITTYIIKNLIDGISPITINKEISIIQKAEEAWREIQKNLEIRRKYFSRSPKSILFSVKFLTSYVEFILNNPDSKGPANDLLIEETNNKFKN